MQANTKPIEVIQAFQGLMKNETDFQVLKKDLIELYFNHSRQLVEYYANSKGICPVGDPDSQLYSLIQIIAVCDAGSEHPLFAHLTQNNKVVA